MSRKPEPKTLPKRTPSSAATMRGGNSSDEDNKMASSAELLRRHQEIGGPTGPEPTRYGDWERKGRCIDF